MISVHGRRDQSNEYVLLRVLEDCGIGSYQLSDTTYHAPNVVSNKLRHVCWFPDKRVSKGDLVSLRTGSGEQKTLRNASGQIVRRFYWGLKPSVWNDDGDAAVLQYVGSWQHFPMQA